MIFVFYFAEICSVFRRFRLAERSFSEMLFHDRGIKIKRVCGTHTLDPGELFEERRTSFV